MVAHPGRRLLLSSMLRRSPVSWGFCGTLVEWSSVRAPSDHRRAARKHAVVMQALVWQGHMSII